MDANEVPVRLILSWQLSLFDMKGVMEFHLLDLLYAFRRPERTSRRNDEA